MPVNIAGFALSALLFAISPAVHAQQTAKIPRIGYISGTGSGADRGRYFEALRQRLQELGYTEGKNIAFEYRGAEGKIVLVPHLVKELVDLNVDVLVVPMSGAIERAKELTKTIPVIIVTQIDPVAAGWIGSLARPGGNLTGVSTLQRDLSGKRLELLKEVVVGLTQIGILRDEDPQNLVSRVGTKDYEDAAHELKLRLQPLNVRGPKPDFDAVFREAAKKRTGA